MQRAKVVLTGVAGGVMAGLTGVGGGVVMIPLMTGLLGIRQHRAHATSLAIVIFVAAVASAQYAARGEVDWTLAAGVAVGGSVGAQLGARTMLRMADRPLRMSFAVFMALVGLRLLILG